MGVFNKDHYPTPEEVILKMCEGIVFDKKHVLEPSVGSGAIVDHLLTQGANVIGCEIDDELVQIAGSKCHIIERDFMKVKSEQVSHIDYIIMNPPFSADEHHILHAWKIAPAGCSIVALCNVETIRNSYTKARTELYNIIDEFGSWDNLRNAFLGGQRSTGVGIALVKLKKPDDGNSMEDEFEGFFMTEDEEQQEIGGIQQYNFIRDVVNRYVGAVKIFDKQMAVAQEMNYLTSGFFGRGVGVSLSFTESEAVLNRETYKKELQKSAWNHVINKFNLEKLVTKSVKEDINKFVEKQTHIPFTMRNIFRMVEIIVLTTENRMDKTIMSVFDSLTKWYKDNRFDVEGWVTNSNYLVNEKFIMPHIFGDAYSWSSGLKVSYSNANAETIDDFIKALCYIEGKNYDNIPNLYQFLLMEYVVYEADGETFLIEKDPHDPKQERKQFIGLRSRPTTEELEAFKEKYESQGYIVKEKPDFGQWFDYAFFKVKGFKKGTGHFVFKDRDVWARFNQRIAKIKGFPLPDIQDRGSKKRADKTRKAHYNKK